MPKLYIVEDGHESVYEIFEDEVTFGRGAANSIQLADAHASKVQAAIRCLQGHWKLIDLESTNGTRVNGAFCNQHWLGDGDTVSVGTAIIRYAAEGAPQGAPQSAAAPAVAAVAARALPGRPAAARPAMPAILAPAPVTALAGAPPAPAAPARRGGASPARRRPSRRDDDYDDADQDDRRPVRRSSKSAPIVLLGIVGAVAFVVIMFAMFGESMSLNQQVLVKADKMADKRQYREALAYAEQNADPDGADYRALLVKMDNWQLRADAQLDLEHNQEARNYYDREIWRKQGIAEGIFRAKDALPDAEIVRLLREFLVKYKGTTTTSEIMNSEHSGYPMLRAAMREHASPDLKANDVLGAVQADLALARSARHFGQAVMDLEYLRDMNRLCMTAENYNELRQAVEFKVQELTSEARTAFADDRRQVEAFLRNEQKGQARRKLRAMLSDYNGIGELTREAKELEQRL